MPEGPEKPFYGILDPIERISEVLFGVIMALTFTCTLGVATADGIQVKTMLIAALGCNLAWGIIDAGVYLIARVHVQGRNIMTLRAVRTAADAQAARRIIADAYLPRWPRLFPKNNWTRCGTGCYRRWTSRRILT